MRLRNLTPLLYAKLVLLEQTSGYKIGQEIACTDTKSNANWNFKIWRKRITVQTQTYIYY